MFFHHHKIKKLLNLIRSIHTVAPWQDARRFFDSLNRVIPFDSSAAFMKMDSRMYKIVPFPFTLFEGPENPTATVSDHNRYFYKFKRAIMSQLVKKKFFYFQMETLAAYLPKLQAEEYRYDFWKKHGVQYSYARFIKVPDGCVGIYLNRGEQSPDFTDEDRTMFDLFIPHLELVLSDTGLEASTFFTDERGKIVFTRPETEAMLKSRVGFAPRLHEALPGWLRQLSLEPLQPLHLEMREKEKLYRFTLSSAGTRQRPLFRVSWTMTKDIPSPPKKLLDAFAREYRLSPRERQLLPLAVAGKQMKEMAQHFGLASDTVKEYLGSIYRKAGVNSRVQLIGRIFSQIPP